MGAGASTMPSGVGVAAKPEKPEKSSLGATSFFSSLESGLAAAKACEKLLKDVDGSMRLLANELSSQLSIPIKPGESSKAAEEARAAQMKVLEKFKKDCTAACHNQSARRPAESCGFASRCCRYVR
jgi:hypothetical protein